MPPTQPKPGPHQTTPSPSPSYPSTPPPPLLPTLLPSSSPAVSPSGLQAPLLLTPMLHSNSTPLATSSYSMALATPSGTPAPPTLASPLLPSTTMATLSLPMVPASQSGLHSTTPPIHSCHHRTSPLNKFCEMDCTRLVFIVTVTLHSSGIMIVLYTGIKV